MDQRTQPAQLEHFLALLERRSFRLAAEHLGISQSALTKSLQRLEQRLGARLFDRTTRSVAPTPLALELRERAHGALLGMHQFEDHARVLVSGAAGHVRLAAVAVAEPLVAQALAQLSDTSPQLELELAVGGVDVYADLEAGRCDLVVGDEISAMDSRYASALRVTALRTEPLVMLYRQTHPLATRSEPTLAEALAFPWAIPSRYFAENRALQELAEYASGPGFPRYRISSVAACMQLVAASDVVGLVPQTATVGANAAGLTMAPLAQPLIVPLATVTLARLVPSPSVALVQKALTRVATAL